MEKIVVIGAGASGLSAAIHAKNKNNEVVVLEKNSFPLKKVLITGAGRCNYFNEEFSIEKYNSNLEILSQIIDYKTEYLNFFEKIGIYPNIANGYYYPYSNASVSVTNALMIEARKKNIKFIYDYNVFSIEQKEDKYLINNDLLADKIIISTGSKAYPKTGSTGEMYDILKNMNIKIQKILPALVQLKTDNKICSKWPNIRVKARLSLKVNGNIIKESSGELQLTDYGISGICTLNLSSLAVLNLYQKNKVEIFIDFLPFLTNYEEFIEKRVMEIGSRNVIEFFEGIIDYKLLIKLFEFYKIDSICSFENLSEINQKKIKNILTNFKLEINDYNDFSSAQVCQGGISLDEINDDFSLKKVKNIYVTGEIVDIHGECGGYNLAFAFISGMIAGKKVGLNDKN